jgi:class 3 adenylate cyclase
MAVEMRTAVSDLTAKWHKRGFDLGFGVGIAHGYATLGRIGFEGRFDYAAIGAVTNLASRLCDEDGQILIDGKVCVAVEEIASFFRKVVFDPPEVRRGRGSTVPFPGTRAPVAVIPDFPAGGVSFGGVHIRHTG